MAEGGFHCRSCATKEITFRVQWIKYFTMTIIFLYITVNYGIYYFYLIRSFRKLLFWFSILICHMDFLTSKYSIDVCDWHHDTEDATVARRKAKRCCEHCFVLLFLLLRLGVFDALFCDLMVTEKCISLTNDIFLWLIRFLRNFS